MQTNYQRKFLCNIPSLVTIFYNYYSYGALYSVKSVLHLKTKNAISHLYFNILLSVPKIKWLMANALKINVLKFNADIQDVVSMISHR